MGTIREEVGNLHDAFLNASLMNSLMLKQPLEEDAAAFMISDRSRLERSWVAYLHVLIEAWTRREAEPARQWIGSVVSQAALERLLTEGEQSGARKAMQGTRDYMCHRDRRGYWDAGRFGPIGHLPFLRKLHAEFSRIFLAVLNETPPDEVK